MSNSRTPGPSLDPSPEARFIPAKVRVPVPRVDVVHRDRLLRRLDDDTHRVVLVSAPPGFGKSVLTLDWLASSGRPAAWFSLDALDNDPRRFHVHLAAALRTLDDPACREAADRLDRLAAGGQDRDAVVAALAEADPGVAIVLDDVHLLEAAEPSALVADLVTQLAGPRLVLLTRVDPPIPLARLRVSGAVHEIRERDLRFTPPEATELLGRLLPSLLDGELVARLEARTEGWAAGLRMAAAAIRSADDVAAAVESFTGRHELLMDYLVEEALARQSEAVQRFLLETSILPRFTPEACIAVTGEPEAAAHLGAVDDANLFLVSLDDRQHWYRYHHLFAELLEFRLRRGFPDRVDLLHDRASRWFESQGDVQEALSQAARMSGPDRLVRLLDRHGYPILARSEFGAFARWLPHVPDPVGQPYPMFLAALAWFRAQTERAPDLGALLGALERAAADPPPGYPDARAREARLHLDALRAFTLRMTDRFDESLELADRALRELPDDAGTIRAVIEFNAGAVHLRLADMARARSRLERAYEGSLAAGIPYLVLASLGHLGAVAAQTEGLTAARQRLEAAVAFARDQGLDGVPAFGIVLYQLAHVHLLGDDPAAARPHLGRALEITRGERETDIRANVLIQLARVERVSGALDRAEALLVEAASLAHAHNVKPFATTLDVERARLARARNGRPTSPESASPSAEPSARWSTLREAETMLRLQHALELDRRAEAADLAARLRDESEPRGRGVALCVARLGLAAVAEDAASRRDALASALELAADRGYVRPVLDGGEPVRSLLEAGLGGALTGAISDDARAFARERLLRGFPGALTHGEPATDAGGDPFGLTEKERETLVHAASGMTNRAIARTMFVSVNTVKTHLKHAFAKLDVSTRTEAVQRARSTGLI